MNNENTWTKPLIACSIIIIPTTVISMTLTIMVIVNFLSTKF